MENQDDLQPGVADETAEVGTDLTETAEGETDTAQAGKQVDPFDEISDIEELRRVAKGERAKATRRNKPKEETQTVKPVTPKVQGDDIDSILTLQAEGRTPAEIKSLREYSRRLGKPISEVANDPVIKAGFDALRQKAATDNAIPSPSKRAPTFKGKTLTETILSGSPADVQTAIEQTLSTRLRPKGND